MAGYLVVIGHNRSVPPSRYVNTSLHGAHGNGAPPTGTPIPATTAINGRHCRRSVILPPSLRPLHQPHTLTTCMTTSPSRMWALLALSVARTSGGRRTPKAVTAE